MIHQQKTHSSLQQVGLSMSNIHAHVVIRSSTEGEDYTSDSTVSLSSPPRPRVARTPQGAFSYIIVGDNIDKTVKPRYMTVDHQRQSLHYFHAYAALDRVDFQHLSNSAPIAQVSSLPNSSFLPNLEDCVALRSNYAVLLARELVRSVPFFKQFAEYVPAHIIHQHSNEMSRRSVVVSCV